LFDDQREDERDFELTMPSFMLELLKVLRQMSDVVVENLEELNSNSTKFTSFQPVTKTSSDIVSTRLIYHRFLSSPFKRNIFNSNVKINFFFD
jgi:hypothetical protein